jgi:2-polyprenyl-6-methoxyphenol hydroxylase-like FAD-dependent oxidoreductase
VNTTSLPARADVAIVGAGPTGLALGVTLASAGIDFVIVDRLAAGANTSRAAVVHARTLEVLDDLGASSELIARGLRINRFAVRDTSRRLGSLVHGT